MKRAVRLNIWELSESRKNCSRKIRFFLNMTLDYVLNETTVWLLTVTISIKICSYPDSYYATSNVSSIFIHWNNLQNCVQRTWLLAFEQIHGHILTFEGCRSRLGEEILVTGSTPRSSFREIFPMTKGSVGNVAVLNYDSYWFSACRTGYHRKARV